MLIHLSYATNTRGEGPRTEILITIYFCSSAAHKSGKYQSLKCPATSAPL